MNINALMKQAQKMQSDMTKAQRELEKRLALKNENNL